MQSISGGNATPAAFLAATIHHERELVAVLATIQSHAESIKAELDGDESSLEAWHDALDILDAVERLEGLLFSATGLREVRL